MNARDAELVKPGTIVKHTRRGTLYEVLVVGEIEATAELCVVYQSRSDGRIWIRPVSEFAGCFPDTNAARFVKEG